MPWLILDMSTLTLDDWDTWKDAVATVSRSPQIVNKRFAVAQMTDVCWTAHSSCSAIHPQHLHKARDLFQMPKRQAHGRLVAAADVDKEAVFPRASAHRPGLNLAQIQIAERKNAERL